MIMEEKTRNCVWCDEEFYLIPNGRKQYCSNECYKQRALANNKNPVGWISSTVGVYERGCCYDEQPLAQAAQWLLDNDDGYSPRITEDDRYLSSVIADLPTAKYTNGQDYVKIKYQIDYQREKKGLVKRGFGNNFKFHSETIWKKHEKGVVDTSESYGERADKIHKKRKIK